MKKLYSAILCTLLMAFLFCPAVLATQSSLSEDLKDAVTSAGDVIEDAVTDIKDSADSLLDPENGKPEAEEDGIVDDDKNDTTAKDTEKDTTDARDTASTKDTTEETTGVIDGMELEKNGINPWAIVVAVIVVIAVLVLIFILIPKRRG